MVKDLVKILKQLKNKFGHKMNREKMKQSGFPPGWDAERVKRVLAHYESQSEEKAVAEDEAAFEAPGQTVMEVPTEIVPPIQELIAEHKAA